MYAARNLNRILPSHLPILELQSRINQGKYNGDRSFNTIRSCTRARDEMIHVENYRKHELEE